MINDYEEEGNFRPQRRFQEASLPALTCEECGSQFFMDVNLNKYAADAHSSSAGGDMQVIGHMVHQIRVCVCGLPVSPSISGGRIGRGATETGDVLKAVDRARLLRSQGLENLQTVIEGAVTSSRLAEVESALLDRIEGLSARLKTFEDMIDTNKKPGKGSAKTSE